MTAGQSYKGWNRRDVLIGTVRWAVGGVAVAAGLLAAAKRNRLRADGVCSNQGLCAGCDALNECRLPGAERLREAIRSQSTHD